MLYNEVNFIYSNFFYVYNEGKYFYIFFQKSVDIEDKIKFAYHNGEKFGRVTTAIIRTDKEGQHYFISGKCKYYLSDFIRVG